MIFLFNAYYLLNFYTKPVNVKINVDDIWKLQVLNVVAWVIQMAGNYIVKKSAGGNRLHDITLSWNIAFKPDRWAFRIWPIIFLFNIFFIVY